MKSLVVAVGLIGLSSVVLAEEGEGPVAVMSFNVRYDNPADGANAWPHRKDWVAEIIKEQADVVGMQEVRKNQLEDLKERLPEYEFYGVGRDDGKEKGEYVPLAWKKDRFEATEKGVFWLSETQDEPSAGWDAQLPRVTTWVRLKDKQSGVNFLAVNTHFDHRGEQARRESGTLLRKWIAEHAKGDPVILTGDFNTTLNSVPYRNLTAAANGTTLHDVRESTASLQGPESTWNGFQEVIPGRRIDFIFATEPVEVVSYRAIDETRDGKFPSDHLPILAKLKIRAGERSAK